MAKNTRKSSENSVPPASEAGNKGSLATIGDAIADKVSSLIGGNGDNGKPDERKLVQEVGKNTVEEFQDAAKPMTSQLAIINANSATVEDFAKLPGIGKATAEKIVEYRSKAKSGFRSPEDLLQIDGISDEKLSKIEGHLSFEDAAADTRSEEQKTEEQARIDAAKTGAEQKTANETAGMKAGSNSFGSINYKPFAKNAQEFEAEVQRVRNEAITFVNRGDISLLAWLSLMAADMVFLATQGDKDQKLKDVSFNLNDTPDLLRKSIEASIRRSLDPYYVTPKKRVQKEDVNRENAQESILDNDSVQQYIPDAAKAACLLLKDRAAFGWYDNSKGKPNWRTVVVSSEDLPNAEENPNMLRCLAAPYNSLRPEIVKTIVDDRTGKIVRQDATPNSNAELVYLNREFIQTLFGILCDPNNYEKDKEGWNVKKAAPRQPAGSQSQTTTPPAGANAADNNANGNRSTAETELVKGPINGAAKYLREAKNDIPLSEVVIFTNLENNVLQAFERKPAKDKPSKRDLIAKDELALRVVGTALVSMLKTLENLVTYNDKGKMFWHTSDGKMVEFSKSDVNSLSMLRLREQGKTAEPPKDAARETSTADANADKAKEPAAA